MIEKSVKEKQSILFKFLGWVERVGNKLPHPFIIFFALCITVIVASAITAGLGVAVIHPTTGEIVEAKS